MAKRGLSAIGRLATLLLVLDYDAITSKEVEDHEDLKGQCHDHDFE